MNPSHSIVDQVSDAFTGRFTCETVEDLIAGGVAAISGLLMVLFAARGKERLIDAAQYRAGKIS